MRGLITGGTGFLGSHLVHALLAAGYEVSVLKRSTSDTWRIKDRVKDVELYDSDANGVERAFAEKRIDFVIHTACSYGRNQEALSAVVDANILFGLRILEKAISFDSMTFVNTDTLLQRDLNDYSLSKKQFVEWLRRDSSRIKVVNMRPELIYGERDDASKFIPWIISQLRRNVESIPLTGGIQCRDFVHVSDVISAYLLAIKESSGLGSFSRI